MKKATDYDSISAMHITTVPQSLAFLKGQADYMRARGIRLHAVSSPGHRLTDFSHEERVDVTPVELTRSISPVRDLASIRALIRVMKRVRPTVVHSHTPKGGLLGMISAVLSRTPVRVYHIRGLPYMTASGRRRALLKATERVSCLLAHRVFCVSHSIRLQAIKDGVCSPEKIVVFGGGSGNGVDSTGKFNPERYDAEGVQAKRSELGIPEDAVVLLFAGRIVRDKGVEELTQAWKQIRYQYPAAWLVMAGPREPQDPVSGDSMTTLIEDERVSLTGMVEEVGIYYALADVVVLPTYREGFPNVLLEAASMGLPVVATRIPGCIDAVEDGVTGTLVTPRSAEALSNAISGYLEDSTIRERHGKAGRDRVLRDFRQDVIWEGIYREYSSLLRSKGLLGPRSEAPAP